MKPMHVDLHVHTAEGSSCSEFPVSSLADLVGRKKLEAVAITDHGSLDGVHAYRALRPKPAAVILAGMELTTEFGDFLLFPPEESMLREFDGNLGGLMPFEEVEKSGLPWPGTLLVWAHPFNPTGESLMPSEVPPEDMARILALGPAIEGMNGQIRAREALRRRFSRGEMAQSMNGRAILFAQERGLQIVYGSDSHTEDAFHSLSTGFTVPVRSTADLAAAVKAGMVVPKWELYFPDEPEAAL